MIFLKVFIDYNNERQVRRAYDTTVTCRYMLVSTSMGCGHAVYLSIRGATHNDISLFHGPFVKTTSSNWTV